MRKMKDKRKTSEMEGAALTEGEERASELMKGGGGRERCLTIQEITGYLRVMTLLVPHVSSAST